MQKKTVLGCKMPNPEEVTINSPIMENEEDFANKENWYALCVAILTGCTAQQALAKMGMCGENTVKGIKRIG